MSTTLNTNPFRSELDPEETFCYGQRRKSTNNPFYNDYHFQSQNDRTIIKQNKSKNELNKEPPSEKREKLEAPYNEHEYQKNSIADIQCIKQEEKSFSNTHHQQRRHHHHHSSSRASRARKDGSRSKSKASDGLELDSIDKLDITGIFFRGGFHHDGPYDAARPQRNNIHNRNAPIMAFPKNSSNTILTRSHTISNSSSQTSFLDPINRTGTISGQFDSNVKNKIIHGHSSIGLGSTTFLEGTPASKEAIEEDIKKHIRRNRTLKDNRRKSIGDFLRSELDSSNITSNTKKVEHQKGENKKENKFLKRVKSLRVSHRS